MFSGIGSSYLTGLVIGGSWGFYEGLRNPDGKTMKLRMNRFLTLCNLLLCESLLYYFTLSNTR